MDICQVSRNTSLENLRHLAQKVDCHGHLLYIRTVKFSRNFSNPANIISPSGILDTYCTGIHFVLLRNHLLQSSRSIQVT